MKKILSVFLLSLIFYAGVNIPLVYAGVCGVDKKNTSIESAKFIKSNKELEIIFINPGFERIIPSGIYLDGIYLGLSNTTQPFIIPSNLSIENGKIYSIETKRETGVDKNKTTSIETCTVTTTDDSVISKTQQPPEQKKSESPSLPPPPGPPCAHWKSNDSSTGVCEGVATSLFQGGTDTSKGNISTDPGGFVARILTIVLSFAGGIALLLIISAGYKIITSSGKPEGIQQGRDQLTSAIVGLLFIIFSFVIFQLVATDILKIPGITK